MPSKKLDRAKWRKRGHARRFTQASVQDKQPSASARAIINRDKPKEEYDPRQDAVLNKNNGFKTRPFTRNTPLDGIQPTKYGQVSIERQKVELKFREVTIATRAFGHYPEHWHCQWLEGKPGSPKSVRLFFYGAQAVLVRYDLGVFERSPKYRDRELALHAYSLYRRGRLIVWMPFDVPLDEVITPPDKNVGTPSTKPLPIKGLHKPWRCKGCDGTDCDNCKAKFLHNIRSG